MLRHMAFVFFCIEIRTLRKFAAESVRTSGTWKDSFSLGSLVLEQLCDSASGRPFSSAETVLSCSASMVADVCSKIGACENWLEVHHGSRSVIYLDYAYEVRSICWGPRLFATSHTGCISISFRRIVIAERLPATIQLEALKR